MHFRTALSKPFKNTREMKHFEGVKIDGFEGVAGSTPFQPRFMSNQKMSLERIFCKKLRLLYRATGSVAGGYLDVNGVCFDNIFHVRQHT